jgi:hypothetical protein
LPPAKSNFPPASLNLQAGSLNHPVAGHVSPKRAGFATPTLLYLLINGK